MDEDEADLTESEVAALLNMLTIPTFEGEWYQDYPESCITKREDNVVYVDFK